MYVCLCHGFTDRQVRSIIEEGGAASAAEIYRKLECRPRCGKCVPYVRNMVKAARGEAVGHGCGPDCACVEAK